MKVACIATSTVPSRTANSIQVMKVCSALAGLDHRVRLWLPGGTPVMEAAVLASHYGVDLNFSIHWLRSARALRRYDFAALAAVSARSWKPDLYYVWPYQVAALTSSLGWPTLLEMHDRPTGRLGPRLVGAFLRGQGARRLVITTEALRSWMEKTYPRDMAEPLALVAPNGVHLEDYRNLPPAEKARTSLELPETYTAVYTGHLYAGRGGGLMLELAARNPEISFVWAGGEALDRRFWEDRARQAGIGNLRILGFLPNADLPLLHAAADVLLMPYERAIAVSGGGDTSAFASPMKAFEYLATGRVILSSDLPVIREVLHPANAVLLPPEDVDAWDQAIKRTRDRPEDYEPLAARAKQDAQRYSWTRRAERALEGMRGSNG